MTLRVTATVPGPEIDAAAAGAAGAARTRPARRALFDGERHEAAVLHRRAGARHAAERPGDLRAARGDARGAAGLGRRRRADGNDPAGARE